MSSSLDSLVNNLARSTGSAPARGGGKFFGFEEYSENQYSSATADAKMAADTLNVN